MLTIVVWYMPCYGMIHIPWNFCRTVFIQNRGFTEKVVFPWIVVSLWFSFGCMFVSFAIIWYIFIFLLKSCKFLNPYYKSEMVWNHCWAIKSIFFMAAYCPKRLYLNWCSMKTLFSWIWFAETTDFSPVCVSKHFAKGETITLNSFVVPYVLADCCIIASYCAVVKVYILVTSQWHPRNEMWGQQQSFVMRDICASQLLREIMIFN